MVSAMDDLTPFFAQVAKLCHLGALYCEPCRISGGFMHRMFRLDTESGSYALKLLNPEILKRPDARRNYRRAEKLEKQLRDAGLPVVAALEFDGKKMLSLAGHDFYLFPWIEGKALTPAEVEPHHCRRIGEILARQHSLPCEARPGDLQPLDFQWPALLEEAHRRKNIPIEEMLEEHCDLLCRIQQETHDAAKRLSPAVCISNGDMDIKNVLWQNGNPLVIDLECLDHGHPEREMLMLALMWAGLETDVWKPDNFRAFVESYTALRGAVRNEPAVLFDSMDVWPEWLHYNVKRALGIEAQDEEERLLGLKQAQFAMSRVLFSRKVRAQILALLG